MSQTRIAGGKWILLLVALSMVASPAVAQTTERPDWAQETLDESTSMVSTSNDVVDADALGTVDDQLAGETINLHVSGADGSEATFSFEMTEKNRIKNLERGARDDATVEMHTEKSTFEEIAHAPDPEQAFRTAVEQGDVEMRGVSTSNSVEWDALNEIADLARSLDLF